jgi:hypothetical protein
MQVIWLMTVILSLLGALRLLYFRAVPRRLAQS